MVKYLASPFLHKPTLNKQIESPIVQLELMDALTNKLNVNISTKLESSGFIEIKIPYQ